MRRRPAPGISASISSPIVTPRSAAPSGESTEMRPTPSACAGYTSFTDFDMSSVSSRYVSLEFMVTTLAGTLCGATANAAESFLRNGA